MNINQIKNFEEHVKSNMVSPVDKQECARARVNGELWTADLWTLAVCDMLINKKYPTHSKKQVEKSLQDKLNMYKELDKIKHKSNTLVIGEIGRGLDLLIAQMIKEWEYIIAYDHVDYKPYLDLYFKDIQFHRTNTHSFLLSKDFIKQDCILIINGTRFRKWDEVNKHIKHIIWNGVYTLQLK